MLSKVYGESTMARSKVNEWHRRFKEGRESIEYNERVGRPSISRNTENVRWCLNVFENIIIKHLNKSMRLHNYQIRRLRESIHRKRP
ncbi:hypothetical protein TNCV_626571 [Trichonephila clavipes]|nr:hypothetical protein TNCV_626571 [Trichonephila clavipes]